MDIEKLNQLLKMSDEQKVGNQSYWQEIWNQYVEESSGYYHSLKPKEAIARMISEKNYMDRYHASSCDDMGVWVRVGDICFIDFGKSYLNEAGYQHFGLVMKFLNNKVLVIPMTSNEKTYQEALQSQYKSHLMAIGKVEGMHKHSVLFLNDAKFINSARIIDVKAHIPTSSQLFRRIKERLLYMIQ